MLFLECSTTLSFNSTLQLINGILSDLQKLLWFSNGTTIVAFSRFPLTWFGLGWTTVFPNNFVLHLKDLKALVFAISSLKLVA